MCPPSYLSFYWAMSLSSFYLSLPLTSPLLATFSLPPSPSVFVPHSLTLPSSLPLLSPFPLPLFLHSFLLFPSVSLSKLRHPFSLSLSIFSSTSFSLFPLLSSSLTTSRLCFTSFCTRRLLLFLKTNFSQKSLLQTRRISRLIGTTIRQLQTRVTTVNCQPLNRASQRQRKILLLFIHQCILRFIREVDPQHLLMVVVAAVATTVKTILAAHLGR